MVFGCECGALKVDWVDPSVKRLCPKCGFGLKEIVFKQLKIDAFLSLDEDKLCGRRKQVLDCIKFLGNPNNREIAEYLCLPINSITPRVNELRKLDKPLVAKDCIKLDKVTGKNTMSWRAVMVVRV